MVKKIKKALGMIDIENDFLDGGKLGVEGSINKMLAFAKFILEHAKEYDLFFISVDFHPLSHCSFKKNGGIWPVHCVQHSTGAAIFQPILDAIEDAGVELHVLTKGVDEDHEEYSVLKNTESNKKLHSLIQTHEIGQVDFAGIAGDYCVKDSMADFHREFPEVTLRALKPFIASIDGGKAFDEFLAKNDSILVMDEAA